MAIRKTNGNSNEEINYEVVEKCGVISTNKYGSLELRYVAWNGREPKYDIRSWKQTDDGETPGKGITLTGEELEKLGEIISKLEDE